MVESTSSSSNVHWVINDNSNPYRSMVIDVMRMNQGYTSEYSIIDEKQNADTTWLFDLLKDSDESL
jgi:tRNA uridine 5-carbamoylmethylation protein Kti12